MPQRLVTQVAPKIFDQVGNFGNELANKFDHLGNEWHRVKEQPNADVKAHRQQQGQASDAQIGKPGGSFVDLTVEQLPEQGDHAHGAHCQEQRHRRHHLADHKKANAQQDHQRSFDAIAKGQQPRMIFAQRCRYGEDNGDRRDADQRRRIEEKLGRNRPFAHRPEECNGDNREKAQHQKSKENNIPRPKEAIRANLAQEREKGWLFDWFRHGDAPPGLKV